MMRPCPIFRPWHRASRSRCHGRADPHHDRKRSVRFTRSGCRQRSEHPHRRG